MRAIRDNTIATDGTYAYFAQGYGLRKITLADGTDAALSTDKEYLYLTYGNSTLYGVTQDGLYSINTSTGAATAILDITGVTSMIYASTTVLVLTTRNSMITVNPSTAAVAYVKQDV